MTLFRILALAILVVLSFGGTNMVRAADSYVIANGGNQSITEHTVCRSVTNNAGATIFVPTKTSAEWSSFYNNPPSGVSIATCATNTCSGGLSYNTGAPDYGSCRVGSFGTNYAHGSTQGTCQAGDYCVAWCGASQCLGDCFAQSGSCSYQCNNGTWQVVFNNCYCSNCQDSCFKEGTLISMVDGTTKPIEDIKAGDMVLAFDKTKPHSKLEPRKVNAQKMTGHNYVMAINNRLFVTESHKFPTLEYGMREAGKLKFGDHLILKNGKKVKVTSLSKRVEKVDTYNIEVDGHHSYVANGYRTGNMLLLPETIDAYRKNNPNISPVAQFKN